MGFKKRGYNRDVPSELVRDYRLFAIACEGEKTEPRYFKVFEHLSNKIKIDIIEDFVSDDEMLQKHQSKSAPKWVLDKAIKYIERNGLDVEDQLWFVTDKDRWSFEQLKELADYCADNANWNIAISNPCFEVWLYLHKKNNFDASNATSCQDFKQEISTLEYGGYHALKFIPFIKEAIQNAALLDNNQAYFLPNEKVTKVYQLANVIFDEISINDFNIFIQTKLPKLIEQSSFNKK